MEPILTELRFAKVLAQRSVVAHSAGLMATVDVPEAYNEAMVEKMHDWAVHKLRLEYIYLKHHATIKRHVRAEFNGGYIYVIDERSRTTDRMSPTTILSAHTLNDMRYMAEQRYTDYWLRELQIELVEVPHAAPKTPLAERFEARIAALEKDLEALRKALNRAIN